MRKLTRLPASMGLKVMAVAIAIALGSSACKKKNNGDGDQNITTTTPEKYNNLTANGLNSLIQTATFDASNANYVYTSDKGTEVYIDGTCLRKNGQPVTGQVDLSFFEAYEFTDMVIANKATMGKNAAGTYEPLRTGGQYYVSVSQDGVPLTINCGIELHASAALTGGFDDEMVGWAGIFQKADLLWQQDTTVGVGMGRQETGYQLDLPGFGWFNCDKLYNDPRPKTALNIGVPASYVDASNVYAIIKGEPHSLGLATYGEWPVGMELYLIFVSESNGQYIWVTKEVTVQAGHSETFSVANASSGGIAQLQAHLATLD